MDKRGERRAKALEDLQQSQVLMVNGHFDYGNGYHGRVYLNPHQLFRTPSTIWRFAQDLIDLMPGDLVQQAQVVAGPATGGALLAHTIACLLDSRRSLTHPPCIFAPFNYDGAAGFALRTFYRRELACKRVLLADDVRNTGETFARCALDWRERHTHALQLVAPQRSRRAEEDHVKHDRDRGQQRRRRGLDAPFARQITPPRPPASSFRRPSPCARSPSPAGRGRGSRGRPLSNRCPTC